MKKEFSIVLLFSGDSPFVHEYLANFRSLFSPFFMFFVKTARNRKIFAENVNFLSF